MDPKEVVLRNYDWVDIPVYKFSYIVEENQLAPMMFYKDVQRETLPKPKSHTLGSHLYSSNAFALILDKEDYKFSYKVGDLIIIDSSVQPVDGDDVLTWEAVPGGIVVALIPYAEAHALEPGQSAEFIFRVGSQRVVMLIGTVVETRRYRSLETSTTT